MSIQKEHPDQRFIRGIITEDNKILKEIYETCSTSTIKLIQQNNGRIEDAQDVFQEALIIILKKTKRSEIILTSKFKTYFLSVCRFIWLKKLRKKGTKVDTLSPEMGLIDSTDIEATVLKRERHTFFLRKMKELSAECQQVLKLQLEGKKMKEIAAIMGYKTPDYARKRKFKCKERFLSRIKQDRRYKEFVED